MTVQLGIDSFLKDPSLVAGKKVALLAHGASVDGALRWTPQLFQAHPEIDLVKLFAPEHGVFGVAQDMESVDDIKDSVTSLNVKSLYGTTVESLKPSTREFDGIDALVIDLQDIGTRFYTYIYTAAFCLEVCAKLNIPVIVLDRPNPLGGQTVEGNLLDETYRSFVGWFSLPVRHGMTIGELLTMWNEEFLWKGDLTIVPLKGWNRSLYFDQTGLTFVPPSPNMPELSTALVYPGGCLIEATQVSEGRGTTRPFEWIGAPYMDSGKLASVLNQRNIPGTFFRPYHFKPGFQKCAKQECAGVYWHVTDRQAFRPYYTGLVMIDVMRDLFGYSFQWRHDPYEFVADHPAIDLLTGNPSYRENGLKADWVASFEQDEDSFLNRRKPHLLYK